MYAKIYTCTYATLHANMHDMCEREREREQTKLCKEQVLSHAPTLWGALCPPLFS